MGRGGSWGRYKVNGRVGGDQSDGGGGDGADCGDARAHRHGGANGGSEEGGFESDLVDVVHHRHHGRRHHDLRHLLLHVGLQPKVSR